MRAGRSLVLLLAGLAAVAGACTRSALDLGSGGWWDPAWGFRVPVDITAGPAVVPSGYSIALTFDHAALVAAGHAAADGRDLRVVEDVQGSPVELDRVLDEGSGWNSASTRLWFRTRERVEASASLRVWLYYGNPAAGPAPEDPSAVYLFVDDFESGGLANWNALLNQGSYWSNSTAHSRSGSHSLHGGATGGRKVILAQGVDASDVEFSIWWYATASTSLDFSQVVRADASTPLNMYKTNFYSASGWDVSKIISDTYTQISNPHGSLNTGNWTRVTMRLVGTKMRVLVDGSQVSPPSGSTDVGTELTHGTVGLQDANVPSGKDVWLDDALARRYVEPEPVAAAGAEEPRP